MSTRLRGALIFAAVSATAIRVLYGSPVLACLTAAAILGVIGYVVSPKRHPRMTDTTTGRVN